MYDRPNFSELLSAVKDHLEQAVIPEIKSNRKLYFQTLVAINLLKISQRELRYQEGHRQEEWDRLSILLDNDGDYPNQEAGQKEQLAELNRQLCQGIESGEFDTPAAKETLIEHLMETTHAQLLVSNPKFLAALSEEDQNNG